MLVVPQTANLRADLCFVTLMTDVGMAGDWRRAWIVPDFRQFMSRR